MNWFDNLSLRGKLILNFVASGGVLIAAVIFCIIQIKSVGKSTDEIARNWLPSVQVAGEISQLRLRYRVRSLEYMLPGSDAEKEKIEKSLQDLDTSLAAALKKYEPLVSTDEEKKTFQEALKAVAAYRSTVAEAIGLAKTGKLEEAQQLRKTTWVKEANNVRDQTDALQKINSAGAAKASANATSDVEAAIKGGMVSLVVGVALAIIVTFLISQRMASRLGHAVSAAREISKGDLTGSMPAGSEDEVGKLIVAMGEMQQALRTALRETTDSAGAILDTSRHLNDAVQQMDQSATIQSTAASAIAANVEELTVSINVVADSTSEAARIATASDEQAGDGHSAIESLVAQIGQVANVVRKAAEQIAQLKDDSEKISNIVAVIKDIADQTNLLALNAAIEAARAGEQGRGFAVVADEVRKLSERTALSTGEIAQMVGAIQQSTGQVVAGVAQGVELADSSVAYAEQAGAAIAKLREMAQRVSEIVGDVDVALREQSAASTEVAKKIEDIATQSEEASAIAHETSRASDSMTDTAHNMQKLVARFRV
ncbi:MAG: methyl-accepting chemotaxis protein [Betaproteobacteria bacterium]|nr:methyl-accepting chemotaxis protein [Betaproteobacteria bacterium]